MNKIVNHTYFDIINTEEKAYLLGFFIADGCTTYSNRAYTFSVNLSEKDFKIINYYHYNICNKHNIIRSTYSKGAINRQPTLMVKWSSKYMSEIFIKNYNIKPRKTYDSEFIFNFDNIPSDLVRHFIRGYFDGDGHISFGNGQLTFAIYGTSKNFLEQISLYLSKLYYVEPIINCYKSKAIIKLHSLRFNSYRKRKFFIKELYDYFYKDSTIYLDRKKDKFENYLNTVLT